jgi:hypothetical protein
VSYQVAVKASLTAKLTIAGLATGTVATGDHIASDLCGLLFLPVRCRPHFRRTRLFADPTLIQVPTGGEPEYQHDEVDLSLASPTLASVSPTPAANGGLNLTIRAQVQSDVHLGIPGPGVPSCEDGPVDVTLTTGPSRSRW